MLMRAMGRFSPALRLWPLSVFAGYLPIIAYHCNSRESVHTLWWVAAHNCRKF